MTQHEELADYMATGMKDYQQGVSLFKNLGINASDNPFFETETPTKIQVNLLNQKLSYYAKIKNIKPRRIITMQTSIELLPEHEDLQVSEPKITSETKQPGFYSCDKIYFSWIPRKTDEKGWLCLTWIRDVLVSSDGENYQVFKREQYQYVKYWFFRIA